VRILRQHIEKLGYKRNFVIYDESEQLGAVKKILAQISAKGEKTDPAAILSLLSRFRNGGERAAIFGDPSVRAMAEHIRSRYESALRACNAVDFDDLILLTLRLFQEHPDALEACRAKYRYVMVDEYQDTNAAQFKLVQALTCEHRNLCVVGDDDQSIYGWRGAEISNLLDMEKHFPETKVVKLEQNYRSTNTILNAANADHPAQRPAPRQEALVPKGDGPKIMLHTFANDEEEARTMSSRSNTPVWRSACPGRPGDPLSHQRPVAPAGNRLAPGRRALPPHWRPELLRPPRNPRFPRLPQGPAQSGRRHQPAAHRQRAGARAERRDHGTPAGREPRTQVLRVRRDEEPGGDDHVPGQDAREHRGLRRTSSSARAHACTPKASRATRKPCKRWADRFLEEIGYFAELRRSEKNPETAENRVRNLKDLIATWTAARAASQPPFDRLQSFLEQITLDNEREDEEEEAPGDAVTLITMHSCKGLEFPNVYIVGMEDGLLPHSRSKVEGTLDEERRLFYVAVTRAMQTLTISHCGGRKKYGTLMPCHPSPFPEGAAARAGGACG
jgi:DNA helicase-2/ATP-dependent DNA helicase PcrA